MTPTPLSTSFQHFYFLWQESDFKSGDFGVSYNVGDQFIHSHDLNVRCQWFNKSKYEPVILVWKEIAKNGEQFLEEMLCVCNIACKLHYNLCSISSDWKKIYGEKQWLIFVICLFTLPKVAAKWQLANPFILKEQR